MTQVAAIFRSHQGLEHALRDLRAAGFDDASIRVQHPDELGDLDDLCRALVAAGLPEDQARTHAKDLGVDDVIVEVDAPDSEHVRWARRVLEAAGADRAHLLVGPPPAGASGASGTEAGRGAGAGRGVGATSSSATRSSRTRGAPDQDLEDDIASDPVDEASMDSFPASDPPAFNNGVARPRW